MLIVNVKCDWCIVTANYLSYRYYRSYLEEKKYPLCVWEGGGGNLSKKS